VSLAGYFLLLAVSAFLLLFSGSAILSSLTTASEDGNMKKIEPPPNDQECTTSKISKQPLLFGVFTFANDTRSMKVMREHYSSNDSNHYVMQSIRSLPEGLWLYDAFPTHKKMMIIQSLDNITDAINIDRRYDLNIIVYDIERWDRTPELERSDPSRSISEGSDIVHEAGYRYGITPDAVTLMDNYQKINWTKIDFLGMQLQRFSQNVDEYSRIAEEISSFARCKNPNIEIFTQLSFRLTDANDMIKVIERVKDIVDGFIIAYDTNTRSDSCISSCSPHDLNSVLDKINKITR
jgi:hypothetical protein